MNSVNNVNNMNGINKGNNAIYHNVSYVKDECLKIIIYVVVVVDQWKLKIRVKKKNILLKTVCKKLCTSARNYLLI